MYWWEFKDIGALVNSAILESDEDAKQKDYSFCNHNFAIGHVAQRYSHRSINSKVNYINYQNLKKIQWYTIILLYPKTTI